MKLLEAIAKFEVQLKADGKSPHTISSYLRDLRYLIPICVQRSINSMIIFFILGGYYASPETFST